MKFLEKEFPKGTFAGQKTDGAFIGNFLYQNLDVYAKKIAKDMHFLLIISGNDSVGNGKSTLATQVGCYLTDKINQNHKVNNTFTSDNVTMSAKKLVETSHTLPKYSVVVLDEGDDLTTHGMKQAAVELKRYFRKCRQLNQILILIIPSFFELPKFYSLARSHCLINVKFHGEFERGVYDFYGPNKKKKLYLKGKREWDYGVSNPDFNGGFFSSYCFYPNLREEIEKYKKKKYQDMLDDSDEETIRMSAATMRKNISQEMFFKFYNHFKGQLSAKEIAEGMGIGSRTADTWLHDEREKIKKEKKRLFAASLDVTTNL